MTPAEVATYVLVPAAYAAGIACAIHALMTKTREPTSAIAWILICIGLPLVGIVFYLTVGQVRLVDRKAFSVSLAGARFREAHRDAYQAWWNEHGRETADESVGFAREVEAITGAPLAAGNALEVKVGGEEGYGMMLEAIAGARRHICLQYYIFDDDIVGERFAEALIERASQGVVVEFLYDAVGCVGNEDAFWEKLERGGVKARPFMAPGFARSRWKINLRDHRKLLLVDESVAFTGSMNVSRRHLFDARGSSRDLVVRVEGPVVWLLQDCFDRAWFFAAEEESASVAAERPLASLANAGSELVQVIESNPGDPRGPFLDTLVTMIHRAEESVDLVTPYFIPARSLLDALVIASRRGVKVRLVMPEETDSMLINQAHPVYVGPMVDAFVTVLRRPGPMLHMKLAVIDGGLTLFGSSNLDNRSHFLNFELDLVVHGEDFAGTITGLIEEEIAAAESFAGVAEPEASFPRRLLSRVASLFSPIL